MQKTTSILADVPYFAYQELIDYGQNNYSSAKSDYSSVKSEYTMQSLGLLRLKLMKIQRIRRTSFTL